MTKKRKPNPQKSLDDLLNYDALSEAENVTGRSYKYDDSTTMLGMLLMQDNGMKKRKALREAGDTSYDMMLSEYLSVVTKAGFVEVYRNQFQGKEYKDIHVILAHPDGLLLSLDTFWGEKNGDYKVNSAKVYYEWKPNADYWTNRPDVTSSGGFFDPDNVPELPYENRFVTETDKNGKTKLDAYGKPVFAKGYNPTPEAIEWSNQWRTRAIWAGDHDAREGIIHNLSKLRQYGKFISPWQEEVKPDYDQLWLYHYDSFKTPWTYSHGKSISHEEAESNKKANRQYMLDIYAKLPQWVRDFIRR